MSGYGYQGVTPTSVAGRADLSKPEPSTAEILLAQRDVECKISTNLIAAWQGFESRYQRSQIESHVQMMKKIKQTNDLEVAAARRIIAGR